MGRTAAVIGTFPFPIICYDLTLGQEALSSGGSHIFLDHDLLLWTIFYRIRLTNNTLLFTAVRLASVDAKK